METKGTGEKGLGGGKEKDEECNVGHSELKELLGQPSEGRIPADIKIKRSVAKMSLIRQRGSH